MLSSRGTKEKQVFVDEEMICVVHGMMRNLVVMSCTVMRVPTLCFHAVTVMDCALLQSDMIHHKLAER